MQLSTKLAVLADAAKYDASCASSGGQKRASRPGGKGIGSTGGSGICHSYAPDGRCISLLKILLTNFCIYDCAYCINRRSSNVARARFAVTEVVTLTLDFYRRNYIEGLFLSSGIIRHADYTMEQLVEVARQLREDHHFRGYIHLKTIPDASPELLAAAGRHADRLSINIELPTEAGLRKLAPEKQLSGIRGAMGRLRLGIDEARAERRAPRFAPAGQSTQMIVGADAADDRQILAASANLYGNFRLKRVYYSAFSPIPDSARSLPPVAPPLRRENRLYQADWLLRFYGFTVDEIAPPALDRDAPVLLPLDIDPKLAWALRHRALFPVDLNRAPQEQMLRVPGLGVRMVKRLLSIRRVGRLRLADLVRLKLPLRKLLPFITVVDHHPRAEHTSQRLALALAERPIQLSLF